MGAQGEREAGWRPGPRQIVVCCDGTNNTLTGGVKDTNVLQLFALLERHREAHPELPEQVLYYDPGVGAPIGLPPAGPGEIVRDFGSRVSALVLGRGIYANIGQAYLHLCREYGRTEHRSATSTSDEIYLFGFSRGAFQVRAVAGMVNLFGLIRPEHEPLLPTLLRVYFAGRNATASAGELGPMLLGRQIPPSAQPGWGMGQEGSVGPEGGPSAPGPFTRAIVQARVALDRQPKVTVDAAVGQGVDSARLTRGDVAEQIRSTFTTPVGAGACVHFLGVWDTVESVGLPGFRKQITSTRSIEGKRLINVRHALALDEHRRQFRPRYFEGPVSDGQTLRQLWFRGVHSDIGGSRPAEDSRLSSQTLHWMVDEAIGCGLRSPRVPLPQAPPIEVMGDQLRARPLWALTGMVVRDSAGADAGTPQTGTGPWEHAPREHASVPDRSPQPDGSAPPEGPLNPWDIGNGPRLQSWFVPLIAAMVLGVASLIVAGASVTPGPLDWRVGGAVQAGSGLVELQLTHLWRPDLADAQLSAWALADRPGQQVSPGWALASLLGFLVPVTVVLARGTARAFGRTTMWRRVGDPPPAAVAQLLGLSLPAAVGGYAVQTVLLAAAWSLGQTPLRWIALFGATAASLAMVAGGVGCAALMMRWLARECRGTAAGRGN